MEQNPSATATALEKMSPEELRARCAQYEKDIERFLWNLGGCDTLASGWTRGQEFNKEMALPALWSVAKLAETARELEVQLSTMKAERDAAEARFIKLREENDETEAQLATLEHQLSIAQEKIAARPALVDHGAQRSFAPLFFVGICASASAVVITMLIVAIMEELGS